MMVIFIQLENRLVKGNRVVAYTFLPRAILVYKKSC